MGFVEHLKQFFGDEIDPAELQTLALHAVASDIRATKPAIANAVWQARQGVGSALDDDKS